MSNINVEFEGESYDIEITYYHPGTNYPIHSASEEPNDPPELEYICRYDGEEVDVDEALDNAVWRALNENE